MEQASEHSVVEIGVTAQEKAEEKRQEQRALPEQPAHTAHTAQHDSKGSNEAAPTVSMGMGGNRTTSRMATAQGEAAAVIPRTLSQDELSRYHTKDRATSLGGMSTPGALSSAMSGTNAVSNQTYASNMLRMSLCKAMLSSDSVRGGGGG